MARMFFFPDMVYLLLSYASLAIKYWWAHFTTLHTDVTDKITSGALIVYFT